MMESSKAPQPVVQTPAAATPDIQKPEPMPVDRQPVGPKPADLVTPAQTDFPKRSIISRLTFGLIGKK
ncbi:MAG: hypothetical protein Q8P25_05020 [Candidatus Curtissbacteria bacterium]|nr:hypothetical protein [Candidatus Curtissbacteria bacterium]